MPTTYSLADPDVLNDLARVVERWHQPLADAEVKWGVLMAANDSGPAVKHGGYPAAASVRIVPLKDRLTKGYDAEIVIDLVWWERARQKHRTALLDHEVSHVTLATVAKDSEGNTHVGRDDLGRPKLKLAKGDWSAGDGFEAVCRRHGEWAVEFENLHKCFAVAKAAAHGEESLNDDALDHEQEKQS